MDMILKTTPMFILWSIVGNAVFGALVLISSKLQIKKQLKWLVLVVLFVGTSYVQLSAPVGLSTDYYRYIWQGRVSNAGMDNYQLRPWDAGVEKQNAQLFERMEWKDVKTVYPPLAEQYFRLHAGLFDAPVFSNLSFEQRLTISKLPNVFMLGLAGALIAILTKNKMYGLLYALSPFVQFEFLGSGHVDIVAIVFVLGAIYCLRNSSLRSYALSGVLIGVATLTKLTPALLIVPIMAYIWTHASKRLAGVGLVLAGYGLVLATAIPAFVNNDFAYPKRLSIWSSGSEFSTGNPLYFALRSIVGDNASVVLKLAGLAIILFVIYKIVLKVRKGSYSLYHMHESLAILSFVPVVASPIVLPWYFILPATLFCLYRFFDLERVSKKTIAILSLGIVVILMQYSDKSPSINETLRHILVYGPIALLSIVQILYFFRKKLLLKM
jgi:hypothetical protein